jgi:hypothetical protein
MIECLFFYSINDTFLRFQLLLSDKNMYLLQARLSMEVKTQITLDFPTVFLSTINLKVRNKYLKMLNNSNQSNTSTKCECKLISGVLQKL